MTEQAAKDNSNIGYVFDFAAQLGNEMTFTIRGNFDKNASAEEISKEVDKLRTVVNRQQSISSISAWEDKLNKQKRLIANMKADILAADKRNEGKRLAMNEQAARANLETTLRAYKDQLEDIESTLATLRKEAA